MNGIDPGDYFRGFRGLDIQVNDYWILTAADKYATEKLGLARVDLLVGHERRNKNEIALTGLCDKLQAVSPSHTCPAADNVYNAFQFSVMVRPGFGIGINGDRARPQFTGPRPGMCDCGRSRHTRRLRRIRIELRTWNDFDSVVAPIWLWLRPHFFPPQSCRRAPWDNDRRVR
ncbi:hypothetical protein GCM10017710_22240 [Arthrobacter ramosus]